MAETWAKLWGTLPDTPKVRREVREHGGSVPWLWAVCILRAKASRARGRIEVEPGVPMSDAELQDASALSPAEFDRALAVLLRWGATSDHGWLVRDPDGALVVRNLGARQEDPSTQRKRDQRDRERAERDCPVNVTGKVTENVTLPLVPLPPTPLSPSVPSEAEAEAEPVLSDGIVGDRSRPSGSPTGTGPTPRKSPKADPRKRIRLVEDEVTGTAHFEGITDEDRAEWAKLAPEVDLDREMARILARRGTHPGWWAKRRKGGHWGDTLQSWFILAQTFAERDRARTSAASAGPRLNSYDAGLKRFLEGGP